MRRAALLLLLVLAGCREAPEPLEPAGPARTEALRLQCERGGGRFGPGGASGLLVCFHETRDAGRQCRAAGDCSGECLARSGTCAPMTPLFGCHEILTASGARLMQCIE